MRERISSERLSKFAGRSVAVSLRRQYIFIGNLAACDWLTNLTTERHFSNFSPSLDYAVRFRCRAEASPHSGGARVPLSIIPISCMSLACNIGDSGQGPDDATSARTRGGSAKHFFSFCHRSRDDAMRETKLLYSIHSLLILSDAIGARSPLSPALRCNYRLRIWLRMGETNWCHALFLHVSVALRRPPLGFPFLAFAACDECLGRAAHRRQSSYAATIMTQRISNSPRLNNNTQRGALALKLWMNSTHYRRPIRHPSDNCCAAKKQRALTANICWNEISASLRSEMIIASTIICILHTKLTWHCFPSTISSNAWR